MSTAEKTVLLVEDNDLVRESLAVALEDQGYDVITVANGQEALNALSAGRHANVVLLDMMLPVKDGWSFLTDCHNDPALASVPVVIMTGLKISSREWAQSLGAAGFLRKPVQFDALLEEISRHC